MLNFLKKEAFQTVVLQGYCPRCHSPNLVYAEANQGQLFWFECRQCNWQETFTRSEFREITASWTR